MSNRSARNEGVLDLKLNLSPPRAADGGAAAAHNETSPESSPERSCVTTEESLKYGSSPETTSSMVVVGCPRCLMYVMLSEKDPRCPKCKSSVLLDFLRCHWASRPRPIFQ